MRHLLTLPILAAGLLAICPPVSSMAQPVRGYDGPPRHYEAPVYRRPYHHHHRRLIRRPPPRPIYVPR